jgi:hypothetical protein
MVSSDLLYQIHNRLVEIKGISKPFGGVSVIAFGDLYQLPPVLQPFVFKPVNDVFANMQGSLWKNFSYRELDEVMRQKEDLHFATLLNRIRTSNHTEEDIAFLRSREISVSSTDYPKEALHIFATNKSVDEHNSNMLNALPSQKVTLVAVDRKPAALSSYDVNSDTRFTGGLPSVISLAIGAKVMLIRNIDVSDGLVNGAQGTVIGFSKSGPEVCVVLIEFNDPAVGITTRQNTKYVTEVRKLPSATPIQKSEISFTVNSKNKGLTITRYQFPLKLAWGCTIHKVQGLTVSKIVVSFKNRFNDGQAYVALSRAKSAEGLFILDFDPKKIRASKAVADEMTILHTQKRISPYYKFFNDRFPESTYFSILNVRSLPLHLPDILQDPTFLKSGIVVLTETWLSNDIASNLLLPSQHYTVQRVDADHSMSQSRRAGGVLISMKKPCTCTVLGRHAGRSFQIIMVNAHGVLSRDIYIASVYNSPHYLNSPHPLIENITSMLSNISHTDPCLVVGDFNEDTLKDTGPISTALQSMGFHSLISTPTHRQGSCLDNIYIRFMKSTDSYVSPNHYSDHFWVSSLLHD